MNTPPQPTTEQLHQRIAVLEDCVRATTRQEQTSRNKANRLRGECKTKDQRISELERREAELAAMVAVLREVLRDAQMHIEADNIDWARFQEGPDHDPNYKPEFPEIVKRCADALAKTPSAALHEMLGPIQTCLLQIRPYLSTWPELQQKADAELSRLEKLAGGGK